MLLASSRVVISVKGIVRGKGWALDLLLGSKQCNVLAVVAQRLYQPRGECLQEWNVMSWARPKKRVSREGLALEAISSLFPGRSLAGSILPYSYLWI